MKCSFAIFSIFCYIMCVQAQSVKYKDCGSQVGIIKKVEVFPCSSFPCPLHKGRSYTANVTFAMKQNSAHGFAYAYGTVSGLKVPFPLKDKDACAGKSGLECPLEAGKTYTYTATLPISKIYPDVKVLVEWDLNDEETEWNIYNINPLTMSKKKSPNRIFCFETLFQIME